MLLLKRQQIQLHNAIFQTSISNTILVKIYLREMLVTIIVLSILSLISFGFASYFLDLAHGNPEGIGEGIWGISFLILGIIFGVLSVISLVIKYRFKDNKSYSDFENCIILK